MPPTHRTDVAEGRTTPDQLHAAEDAAILKGELPSTMRAVVMHAFGSPEVLQVERIPLPVPGDGEVLIKVHAVSVNRTLDVLVRRDGNQRGVKLPSVLGVDPSGVIVALGPGVRERQVGDHVAVVNMHCGTCTYCLAGEEDDCLSGGLHVGITRQGGYAEYVALSALATARLPQQLPFA